MEIIIYHVFKQQYLISASGTDTISLPFVPWPVHVTHLLPIAVQCSIDVSSFVCGGESRQGFSHFSMSNKFFFNPVTYIIHHQHIRNPDFTFSFVRSFVLCSFVLFILSFRFLRTTTPSGSPKRSISTAKVKKIMMNIYCNSTTRSLENRWSARKKCPRRFSFASSCVCLVWLSHFTRSIRGQPPMASAEPRWIRVRSLCERAVR